MTTTTADKVFDYRTLRLLIGLIAFALPFVADMLATIPIASISGSYYTDARDAFVGMLFVVGAFLWAYNGHTPKQRRASKIASIAAICIALFPTACELCDANIIPDSCVSCETSYISVIHYISAGLLFSILAYFCLGPFREKTKGQPGQKGRRGHVYFVCGWVMVICILTALAANFILSEEAAKAWKVTYWAEAVAMCAFGIAWFVAGKWLIFVDKEDAIKLFAKAESKSN